jgi:hypothetical protein
MKNEKENLFILNCTESDNKRPSFQHVKQNKYIRFFKSFLFIYFSSIIDHHKINDSQQMNNIVS